MCGWMVDSRWMVDDGQLGGWMVNGGGWIDSRHQIVDGCMVLDFTAVTNSMKVS